MPEIKVVTFDFTCIPDYISVEMQLLLDAEKYIKRAEMYLIVGKSRHCLGCLIKAAKKYDKAKSHILSMDGLTDSFMRPMVKALDDAVANCILNLKA